LVIGASTDTGCSLSGDDVRPEMPAIYIFRHQQVWLTPDEREAALCWNGGQLLCSGGLGRLASLLCECPL
jgi:hypothetical protein